MIAHFNSRLTPLQAKLKARRAFNSKRLGRPVRIHLSVADSGSKSGPPWRPHPLPVRVSERIIVFQSPALIFPLQTNLYRSTQVRLGPRLTGLACKFRLAAQTPRHNPKASGIHCELDKSVREVAETNSRRQLARQTHSIRASWLQSAMYRAQFERKLSTRFRSPR